MQKDYMIDTSVIDTNVINTSAHKNLCSDNTLPEVNFIEKFWSEKWDADKRDNSFQKRVEKTEEYKIMDPFMRKLKPQSKVLDGGCGLGDWTMYWQGRGHNVTGLDISSSAIAKLNNLFPEQEFFYGDIRNTKFESNSLDAYFSWGTFEHFENGFADCFQEAYRILKPGGYLFLTVPYYNHRHYLRNIYSKKFMSPDNAEYYKAKKRFYQWRLSESELIREYEIHNFNLLKISPIGKIEGLQRCLQQEFKMDCTKKHSRILLRLLSYIVPVNFIGHMVMAVGVKRAPID